MTAPGETHRASAPFLPSSSALVLLTIPAAILLANGVLVTLLRAVNAAVPIYMVGLPVAVMAVLIVAFRYGGPGFTRHAMTATAFGVLISGLHLVVFGASTGSDAAYYHSFPIHQMLESGSLSFRIDPFVEFGEQPVQVYWLHSASEYALTVLSGGDFTASLTIAAFVSNLFLSVALFVIVASRLELRSAIVAAVLFIGLMYCYAGARTDIVGMSLHRAAENKGLIFGYFFWATIALVVPNSGASRKSGRNAAVILVAAAFFVSGNFALLWIPALALALGAVVLGRDTRSFGRAADLLGMTVFGIAVVSLLQPNDVMEQALGTAHADDYAGQSAVFKPQLWEWVLAVIAIGVTRGKVGLAMAGYVAIGLLIHSEMAYDFLAQTMPERAIIFWRIAILFSPLPPILFGLIALAQRYSEMRQTLLLGAGAAVAGIAMALTGSAPYQAIYLIRLESTVYAMLDERCDMREATILTDRRTGTFMPAYLPGPKILSGKEYFLNWQIANLAASDPIKLDATAVRDAVLHLSGKLDAPETVCKAIEAANPDMLLYRSGPEFSCDTSLGRNYVERSITAKTKSQHLALWLRPLRDIEYTVHFRKGLCTF